MTVDIEPVHHDSLEVPLSDILVELGLEGEDFDETPRRVAAMLRSFRQGSDADLSRILKSFTEDADNVMVVQTDIPFKGLCAHHLLPFFGTAMVGYIPRGRKVGLSKLTRLVQAAGVIAPSTQEHITSLVTDTLYRDLDTLAAGCVTRAVHGCMAVRGVNASGTFTTVSALKGQFLLNPAAKQEFMAFWSPR